MQLFPFWKHIIDIYSNRVDKLKYFRQLNGDNLSPTELNHILSC